MPLSYTDQGRPSWLQLLQIQGQVLHALILRDIKTRFFGSAWGFLVALAWPLAHILIILVINSLAGRLAPYGDSPALWFATGTVPFMAFSYMSRFIMFGIVLNRPLLIFPYVKIMDILMARAVVEVLSAGAVILILTIIFYFYDINFVPTRVVDAAAALGAAFLLGLGMGVINAIIAQAVPFWTTVYSLSMVVFWLISGVFFVPDYLPEAIRYPLSLNPVLHIVSWFRAAYYDDYGLTILNKYYVIGYALLNLFFGLVLERLVRGRLLQG